MHTAKRRIETECPVMYDTCTLWCCNQIPIRSIVWITKLKILKWIPSLRSARHVVTKMVFILCSIRKMMSPNGFSFAHPVMRYLISGLQYKVQSSGLFYCRTRILNWPQTRRRLQLCRARPTRTHTKNYKRFKVQGIRMTPLPVGEQGRPRWNL